MISLRTTSCIHLPPRKCLSSLPRPRSGDRYAHSANFNQLEVFPGETAVLRELTPRSLPIKIFVKTYGSDGPTTKAASVDTDGRSPRVHRDGGACFFPQHRAASF